MIHEYELWPITVRTDVEPVMIKNNYLWLWHDYSGQNLEKKYKITDFEIESYSLDKNALLIYFQNGPDK